MRAIHALGFLSPLGSGLGRLHIPRGGLQDLPGVVAQGELIKMLAGSDAPREDFPPGEDRFHIRQNEISKPHSKHRPISFSRRLDCYLGETYALYALATVTHSLRTPSPCRPCAGPRRWANPS